MVDTVDTLWRLSDTELLERVSNSFREEPVSFADALEADFAAGILGTRIDDGYIKAALARTVEAIRHVFDKEQTQLRLKICRDLHYCDNIRTYGDDITYVTALVEALASFFLHVPGATTLAVWLIKRKFLDALCECP